MSDKKERLDKWIRYPIENVMWQGGKGANINKGYDKANDISIWIPYDKNKELDNVPFSIGDIIVEGKIRYSKRRTSSCFSYSNLL